MGICMFDWPEHSHTSPKRIFSKVISESLLFILMVCGSLLLVVLTSILQLPSLSASTFSGALSHEASMEIFSLASAQPQIWMVVLRCKTILEDTMAGSFTSACTCVAKRRIRAATKEIKDVLFIFSWCLRMI